MDKSEERAAEGMTPSEDAEIAAAAARKALIYARQAARQAAQVTSQTQQERNASLSAATPRRLDNQKQSNLVLVAIDICLLISLIFLPWFNSDYYFGTKSFTLPGIAIDTHMLSQQLSSYGIGNYGGDNMIMLIAGIGVVSGIILLICFAFLFDDIRNILGGNTKQSACYYACATSAIVAIVAVFYVDTSVSSQFGSYSSYAYSAMSDILSVSVGPIFMLIVSIAAVVFTKLEIEPKSV